MPIGIYKRTEKQIEHATKMGKANKGYKQLEKHKRKISEANKGISRNKGKEPWNKNKTKETDKRIKKIGEASKGEKCHFWKDGKAIFKIKLKEYVRIRDEFRCQNPWCGKKQNEKKQRFHTHHIEKNDNSFWLRIFLCFSCHMKAEGKQKQYWKNIYEIIMKIKYFNFLMYVDKHNGKFPFKISFFS